MYVPVLIVGSGIAGMSVALNLIKKNINYLIITKSESFLTSNSILAPANIRYFKDDYKKGINLYMEQCGGNYETIKKIYSNQQYLIETLKELNIKTNETPIGLIPNNENYKLKGLFLIEEIHKKVNNILEDTFLVDFNCYEDHVKCLLYNKQKGFLNINCGALVISTGGFASLFKNNDNSKTATGECTYLLQKHTNKLKGASTIMFHPFGVYGSKNILTR